MRKKLHDFFNADLEKVFFNEEEFAETLLINGNSVKVVRDPYQLLKAKQDGLENAELVFSITKKELGYRPISGEAMKIGKVTFRVMAVSNEDETYVITLGRNQ
ncbi:hypothetical protein M4D71_23530 [Niallia taxi]|uniref:hypothetical protein n=1 Tax=Niallia taxi TaxID=2499688 RepID=UPI0021A468C0|nr:hypothetical protein [Niallia taxi]MCT2347126.1 hypothetical protein [Niallia taxi]